MIAGLHVTEVEIDCPLDWNHPDDGREITVFARVVAAKDGLARPYLVFLQGGPGSEAPRPWLEPASPPWLPRALEDYQVVLLDQRGTGRSTPVGHDLLGATDAAGVAEILTHLRADSIVSDCEALREHLGVPQWSVLGQSFGGFCLLNYLSRFPGSIAEAYFTGGLSAIGRPTDEVYALCYAKMAERSRQYYRWFPGDRAKVQRLVELARQGELRLPNGDRVRERRLRSLGHMLGTSDGAHKLHWLLELDPATNAFRHDLAAAMPFRGRNPLYSVVHESSYSDGFVTDWAAERVLPEEFTVDETLLTGEHLFREFFEDDSELAPWAEVAEIISQQEWPRLYDADALAASGARGAAAVYHGDVYVPVEFSLETAKLMPGVRPYVTSEYEHNGLRANGGAVLDRLIRLAKGDILR